MSRTKKDAKVLNVKLERSVHEKLETFCDETGMTKTVATEKILANYLNDYFLKPEDKRRLFN